MRIAVIADIHSNILALDAVLEDLRPVHADVLVNLGDSFNGPIDPAAVARRLRALADVVHVRGNGERLITSSDSNVSRATLFTRERLSADDLRFAASWPATCSRDGWLACHGSPRSDTDQLLEKVGPAGVALKTSAEIIAVLGETTESLIFCAHTHLPRTVRLQDARIVVNPGSVGLQAYHDKTPVPHSMDNGSPYARYAVVEQTKAGWSVALKAIPYDWEAAAEIAERNGFPEWAPYLRTGYTGKPAVG